MISVFFDRSFKRGGWEIYASRYTETGRKPFRITIEELPEISDMDAQEPAACLSQNQFQPVIDAVLKGLQEAKLMPLIGATEAELKATERHLEDMRSLVFEQVRPKYFQLGPKEASRG